MIERDRGAMDQFERRFSEIETVVADPPTFRPRREREGVVRIGWTTAGLVALAVIVMTAVFMNPLAPREPAPTPPAVGAVLEGTPEPSPAHSLQPRPSLAAIPPTEMTVTMLDLKRAATRFDGERLSIRGFLMSDDDGARICYAVLESYRPGCAGPWVEVRGDLPDVPMLQRQQPSGDRWGDVTATGTFRVRGGEDLGVLDAEAIVVEPQPGGILIPTVMVDDWNVQCLEVDQGACRGSAERFINLLARNGPDVFERSGGVLGVEPRPRCPPVPNYADPDFCWQVTAALGLRPSDGAWCMALARRSTDLRYPPYVHVGGPDGTGRAGGMPDDWPECT